MSDGRFDAVVIGAGAAGLFCAGIAGQRGLKVLLLDHAEKVAEKIRISGGGRCNFTNRELDPRAPHRHYLGENPAFCRSALARYTPADFIALVQRHGIPFHEKHKGQLFGDRSSEDFIRMLLTECAAGGVTHWQPCAVAAIGMEGDQYLLQTARGPVRTRSVVIATGGLSIPKIGATDFGLGIARQFGLRVVTPRPALVPLTFDGTAWAPFADLAGLALPVRIATGEKKTRMAFDEDLLFTHRGLSGPGVLQISSYWREGTPIEIDLAPGTDLAEALHEAKASGQRRLLANLLAQWVPSRLADAWVRQDAAWQRPAVEAADRALAALAQRLAAWQLVPTGTEGWRKAEVMAGGVDTRDLSQQTLESRQRGLYFIGEVVDVTGWLGGYNFQWAWASAHACGMALPAG
ncbi:NAD(P)/FAD-dependent oxidoreductase [Ramlibacter sp.]|uniref:NAD(P)/FAD-dependent oxidoreductase n=1 Tax=Ramlibacter sp. TaxID=1917967 RepID=UPI0035B24C0C